MPDALPEPARDLDGDGPIWQQIRRAIARPILNGDWAPGSRVPSEFDLMERYGAARMTVHRAIRSLASDGLVERRRKSGTIVAVRPPERPVFEIWNIAAEVERRGAAYRFELLERVLLEPGDERGGPIGVDDGTPLLWLVCRHFSDGQVLQLEERLINLAASPDAAEQDFDRVSPGLWLLHNVAWTEAEHAITAEGAPEAISAPLDVAPDAACLVVERRTWNGLEPVTYVRLWHPGDRHRLVGRFKPVRA
ncbi:MAG TPA: UTRA domain-containing protein [Stellaceae bacterium]|nr:UTRA domain-containing protein [Stellaceae bacterium]